MFKVIFATVVACLLFAVILSDPVDFTLCMDNPSFETKTIDLDPPVAKPGQNVSISISGVAHREKTNGGEVDASVYFKNVKLFEFKYNLCDVTVGGCPISEGETKIQLVQQVPPIAFLGTYTSKSISIADGDQVACVSFNFTVAK